jgi:hypothetical protein
MIDINADKQKRDLQKSISEIKEQNVKLGFTTTVSDNKVTKNVIYTNHKMKAQILTSETNFRKTSTWGIKLVLVQTLIDIGASTNEKVTIYYNRLYNDPKLKQLYDTWKQQKEKERIRLLYKFPKPASKQDNKGSLKDLKTRSASPNITEPSAPSPTPLISIPESTSRPSTPVSGPFGPDGPSKIPVRKRSITIPSVVPEFFDSPTKNPSLDSMTALTPNPSFETTPIVVPKVETTSSPSRHAEGRIRTNAITPKIVTKKILVKKVAKSEGKGTLNEKITYKLQRN